MRVLEIVERHGAEMVSHSLCYLGQDAGGRPSFNGRKRVLRLLAPGNREMDTNTAGFVLPRGELPVEGFLVMGDVLCGIERADGDGPPALSVLRSGFVSVSTRCVALRPLRTGILTVSDKGSRGEREDRSGPALGREIPLIGGVVVRTAVVPDDVEEIAATLREWCDRDGLQLILTTGGTGFSPRDVTPEALELVGERKVPGLGEAMRLASLRITPRAVLSRGNSVIRGRTLLIALPGSAKAAVECFSSVAESLRHGVEILCGWDSECGTEEPGGNGKGGDLWTTN
jgi:molybdenum cofactor synthesis domain-containing protein